MIPFERCFYDSHPHTCGTTRWALHSTSHKGKEGSKEIPSCQCSTLWQHGSLVAAQERTIGNEKAYLDDVVCTVSGPEHVQSIVGEELPEPTSKCIMAKPRSGTEEGDAKRNRGTHKSREGGEARCRCMDGWASQLASQRVCASFSTAGNKQCCLRGSHG